MMPPSQAPTSAGTAELERKVLRGDRVDLVGGPATGRTRALLQTADALRSRGDRPVVVRISPTLDKVEYALVALADAIGPDCSKSVDERLRRAPGRIEPALEIVHEALGSRPLLVDDADDLVGGGLDDLEFVFSRPAQKLASFFGQHALLRTIGDDAEQPPARTTLPSSAGGVPAHVAAQTIDVSQLTRRVGGDGTRLHLAVARALLADSGEADSQDLGPGRWNESSMLEDVWTLADSELKELLKVLAAHVRPIDKAAIVDLGIAPDVLERARTTWLVEHDGSQLWLARAWLPWISKACDLRTSHERLAQLFERRADSVDLGVQIAMMETFRHYVAADDDLTRARRFLSHGVAALLERAHDLSVRENKWTAAARLYGTVLDLDKQLRLENEGDPEPIGRHPRAYAKHYWHYNRYKANAEGLQETERGYQTALVDWPTNALFWSRLVVARFVAGRWEDATKALVEARQSIPSQRARDRRLTERTTRRLLVRSADVPSFSIAALLVWRDHHADDPIYGNATGFALEKALKKGASIDIIPSKRSLLFHGGVRVSFVETDGAWACRLEDLDVMARAETAIGALERAAADLRAEVGRLLATLTHKLSSDERERKRLLLGRVDVVASGITDRAPEETWILAKVERPPNGPPHAHFLQGSQVGMALELGSVAVPQKVDEDDIWLVRVKTELTGAPTAGVLAFEEALTGAASDAIWVRWAERWQHHA